MARRTDQVKTDEQRPARAEQLISAAGAFIRTWKEWQQDASRRFPDDSFWDSAKSLLDVFCGGKIPMSCGPLGSAVAVFGARLDEFDGRDVEVDEDGDLGSERNLMPPKSFWAAVEDIEIVWRNLTNKRRTAPFERIADLHAKGATPEQIAKAYRFRDRYGRWMTELVLQELEKPGSVIDQPGSVDGQDWQNPFTAPKDGWPDDLVFSEEVEKKLQRDDAAPVRRTVKAKKQSAEPCPESPAELWLLPGMSVEQAAKMLSREQTEVAQMFADFDQQAQTIRELRSGNKGVSEIAKALGLEDKFVSEVLRTKSLAA